MNLYELKENYLKVLELIEAGEEKGFGRYIKA